MLTRMVGTSGALSQLNGAPQPACAKLQERPRDPALELATARAGLSFGGIDQATAKLLNLRPDASIASFVSTLSG
jgi:hypothetical protein